MTNKSAELALLTALTSDLKSQMMIAKANDEIEDSHWTASLRQPSLSGRIYNGCQWENAT